MVKPIKLIDILVEFSIAGCVDYQRVCEQRGVRFRIFVHSDSSYPNQSRARVDRWDGVRWQEVHRVDPMAHFAVWKALSGYLPVERHGVVRAEAARFAAELLAVALRVAGP
jgi:hypothetical protein